MNKLFFFSLVACAIFAPGALYAQKTTAKKLVAKLVSPRPNLATQADTLSYALGINLVEGGLKPYLAQMGVITDTTVVRAEYEKRIQEETDASKKNKLTKELDVKLDSLNVANTINLEEFLVGFSQTIKQDKSKAAYNSGVSIGSQLSAITDNFSKDVLGGEGLFNTDAFIASFSASVRGDQLLLANSEEIINDAAQKAQTAKDAAQSEQLKAQYATEIAKGKKFLTENKTKSGVVTLPSGLQYKVITEGTGAKPAASDRVTVHYKGTLLDGTVFDSSIDRGEPATFGVGQVIKGWTEALQLMPVGSKWMLYIPYDLAYGSRDQGVIKPFSDLIFEVELIDIAK